MAEATNDSKQITTNDVFKADKEKSPAEILREKKQIVKVAKKTVPKAGPKAKRTGTKTNQPTSTGSDSKVVVQVKRRSPLEKHGKKYRQAYKLIDAEKEYELKAAVELLTKTSFAKFDPTVELHINLGIDPKQADQMVRGTVTLPHGSGKSQRVAALAPAAKQAAAQAAGADVAGHENLLEDIGKGKFDFDILVTTPDMMSQLGQHAKLLGPKGLMPNPKSGTVTNNLAKIIKELKGGRIEFRIDPAGIIHQPVGKLSLKREQLMANIQAFLKALQQAKPSSLKGTYIENITLTTSMGPGIKLSPQTVLKEL